jgi:hypothetical protein
MLLRPSLRPFAGVTGLAQFAASPMQTPSRSQTRHRTCWLLAKGLRKGLTWPPMSKLTELLSRIQAGSRRFWPCRILGLAQVAQMRYFEGYSDVTERTVQRDWEKARLILAAALR